MTSRAIARRSLVVLLALSTVALGMVAAPIAQPLFLAAVLAGALHPVEDRLARRLRGRRDAAAATITLGVLLAVLAPLSFVGAFLVKQVVQGLGFLAEVVKSEGAAGLVARLPEAIREPVALLARQFPAIADEVRARVGEQVGATGGRAATMIGGVVSASGSLVVQTVLALIALYFLLVDGPLLVGWLEQVSPLGVRRTRELVSDVRKVAVSVITTSLLTAGLQAAAALVGYLIASVPEAAFFTVLTFFLAFVPSVGASSACLLAAAVLLVGGHPVGAAFVAIWGVVVVGLVDNLAKPLLMKSDVEMHGAVVFFALLGGLGAFGAIGLLVGPLAVALFLAVVRLVNDEMSSQTLP
jgi:predicted PurR-regulated permease PerM